MSAQHTQLVMTEAFQEGFPGDARYFSWEVVC